MNDFEYVTISDIDELSRLIKQRQTEPYAMNNLGEQDWKALALAVNVGIDSRLEAVTKRSEFDNGSASVHPEELPTLVRRLLQLDGLTNEDDELADASYCLGSDICETLDIEWGGC